MAEAVAAKETTEGSSSEKDEELRFDTAVAHGGTVDIHFIAATPSVAQNMKARSSQLRGLFAGYYCNKYQDDVLRGLSIHYVTTLSDGSPVIDFAIDKSSCGG